METLFEYHLCFVRPFARSFVRLHNICMDIEQYGPMEMVLFGFQFISKAVNQVILIHLNLKAKEPIFLFQ